MNSPSSDIVRAATSAESSLIRLQQDIRKLRGALADERDKQAIISPRHAQLNVIWASLNATSYSLLALRATIRRAKSV